MNMKVSAVPTDRVMRLGNGLDKAKGRPRQPILLTPEELVTRFEAAGATLLAMPGRGYSTHLRTMKFDVVQSAMDAYGWQGAVARPPAPGAAAISLMDETFGWLALIPEEKYVWRRIVGARALVHPLTGRWLFPWRRIASILGADHKSVRRWHGQAIDMLVRYLREP